MTAIQPKGPKMDIEEFENQEQPRAKRSRLDPYQVEIFRLKDKGYANWQVCKWLSSNGLTVSPEAVRKFIKSRSENVPKWSPKNRSTPEKPTATSTAAATPKKPEHTLPSSDKFVFDSNPNIDDLV